MNPNLRKEYRVRVVQVQDRFADGERFRVETYEDGRLVSVRPEGVATWSKGYAERRAREIQGDLDETEDDRMDLVATIRQQHIRSIAA